MRRMRLLDLFLVLICLIQGGRTPAVAVNVDHDLPGWMGESYNPEAAVPEDLQQESLRIRSYTEEEDRQVSRGFDPTSVIQLSWKPRAFLAKRFLSDSECDHLIKLAKDKLEESMVADNESGKSVKSKVRTSSGMFLRKGQDAVVSAIEDRIAVWTLLPKENAEQIQVLRYKRDQKYEPHFDFFHDKNNQALGGHRMATVLMYLSDVIKGGETIFPSAAVAAAQDDMTGSGSASGADDSWSECGKRGLGVKPKKGDALLFFSLDPSATPDEASLHMACPVIEGEKWSAPVWIHVGAYDRKQQQIKIGNSLSCENENPLCDRWAASGECKNNPAYMVGTSELPGACRKACKLC
ncbi:hypothetical protein BDL97_08G017200 [Sphagnum fallax]|jgi:prolyl 4-hydroxylase|nr:hypothetical protein BDL97_08G017200 [Sphagnum fallax]